MAEEEQFQNFITKINDFNGEFSGDFKKEIIDAFNLLKNQNARLKGIIAAKDAIIRYKELGLTASINLALSTKKDLEKAERELLAFKAAAIASKKGRFLFTLKHQNWSLPDSLIFYMTKNPATSKCYQKMVESCKHFFIKNPILIVPQLYYGSGPDLGIKLSDYSGEIVEDLKNLSCKLWITESLPFFAEDYDVHPYSTENSSIIPKIYRCDASFVMIHEEQLSFNEFLFLSSNAEILSLSKTVIKNEDGTVVPLEKLIEAVPKVKKVNYDDCKPELCLTSKTLENLIKIPHFSNIVEFKFFELSESFNLDTLVNYVKTKNKITKFDVCFDTELISDAFFDRIEPVIEEMKDNPRLKISTW